MRLTIADNKHYAKSTWHRATIAAGDGARGRASDVPSSNRSRCPCQKWGPRATPFLATRLRTMLRYLQLPSTHRAVTRFANDPALATSQSVGGGRDLRWPKGGALWNPQCLADSAWLANSPRRSAMIRTRTAVSERRPWLNDAPDTGNNPPHHPRRRRPRRRPLSARPRAGSDHVAARANIRRAVDNGRE